MGVKCPVCCKTLSSRTTFVRHASAQHPADADRILKETDSRRPTTSSPLLSLRDHWETLPIWHPQRQNGLQVFQFLIERNIPLLQPLLTKINDSFVMPPNIAHIEEDVRHNNKISIICTSTGTVAPHLTASHLNSSFRVVETGNLMGMSPSNLCAANSIIPTSQGLDRCRPYHASWRNDHGVPAHGTIQSSFAYCPKGHITDVHQDSIFEGRFTTALFGRKLFLTWPTSKENLNIYAEIHGQFAGFSLPSLLGRFQGLQATLHTHGSVTFMPPGTIHAVLNIDSAATFAYDVVCKQSLPDVLRLVRWERRIANRLLVSGDHTETVTAINDEHRQGIELLTTFSFNDNSTDVTDSLQTLPSLRP